MTIMYLKVCVHGLRWADGINLQVMMAFQGLYHDLDYPQHKLAFNLAIASSRQLCRVGSLGVLFLQLLMPLFLVLEGAYPESRGKWLAVAFWLAMSFHASNHILWRINFFGSWCPALLALLFPMKQLSLMELWQYVSMNATSASVLAPMCVVVIYFSIEMGHALNLASEKFGKWARRNLNAMSFPESSNLTISIMKALQATGLCMISVFEFLNRQGFYAEYYPDKFPDRKLACIVIKWQNGDYESILPAPVDFYFRRHINAWIVWPRQIDGDSDMMIEIQQASTPGGSAMANTANGLYNKMQKAPQQQMKLSMVLEQIKNHVQTSYLSEKLLRDIRQSKSKVFLRVRDLEYFGTALYVKRLWEREIDFYQN